MHIDTNIGDLGGGQEGVRFLQTPDVCPRCHRSVHPKFSFGALLRERQLAQIVFRCTHQKCQELFVATYANTHKSSSGRPEYELRCVAPQSVRQAKFPDTVTATSPAFVMIFDQTLEAEAYGLDQLVGIGLRKALEFLVKDYAVSEHAGNEESIRKSTLASCITEYVSDENVKECARRAAWLGNDETHYTRKWETKDINDLKLLVRLTVNWIDNALLTKKYIAEMAARKP